MKFRAASALLLQITIQQVAFAEIFSCAELGAFAKQISLYRDKGIPINVVYDSIEKSTMTIDDKKRIFNFVKTVYSLDSVTPDAMGSASEKLCATARAKEKRK